MAGSWQGHERVMAGSWQGHGRVMAGSWQGHGRVMAGSWQGHGTLDILKSNILKGRDQVISYKGLYPLCPP